MKKHLTAFFAALVLTLPVLAVTDSQALDGTLGDVKAELRRDYVLRQRIQEGMDANFDHQHARMREVIKKCDELSVMLYLQKKEYTFDLSYALEQVTSEYQSFSKNRTPYDRVVGDMDTEIDRYGRLIESLHRLPTPQDSASFLSDRDSCLYYASEILGLYLRSKSAMVADSTQYREAFLRLKESYDYAKDRYTLLQREIFRDGQFPVWEIMARPKFFRSIAESALTRRETNVHMTAPLWTFFWLLLAIAAALSTRLSLRNVRKAIGLLLPTVVVTLVVIFCRITFMPNILMNLLFPTVMTLTFVWQLITCMVNTSKVDREDKILGWASVGVIGASAFSAIIGYIFISLMIVTWWYFQLAALMALLAIYHLLDKYKEKRLKKRLDYYDRNITFVTGADKKAMMFSATWFYDLVKDLLIPLLILVSFPLCIRYSLDIFDFTDLFQTFYNNPFFQVVALDGGVTFRLSVSNIVIVLALYFVFNYFNKAVQAIWQQYKFAAYLHKTGKTTVLSNEVNLSLGKSVIAVLVWLSYITVVVLLLKIPTGSLGLVAGGLSAGLGLAMKDILNNFIYGIQLMSGRLRVGDWIECDGVRGRVTDINYQSVLVETVQGTQVAFLNSTLFGKSFNNLTRNDSYEFVKVTVGVAYGVDVDKLRAILEKALQAMYTKDGFGRDIVDRKRGISIRFNEFGDSAVEIAVKQFVLVPERSAFIDREKELIYKTLNENGISIPFPQRDVHMIKD